MYEVDVTQWDETRKKKYRENRLNELPNVLFKLFDPPYPSDMKNLCGLLFGPTSNSALWMIHITDKFPNLTFQWTRRQVTKPVRDVIYIEGSSEEMEKFCKQFRKLLEIFNPEDDLGAGMGALAVK